MEIWLLVCALFILFAVNVPVAFGLMLTALFGLVALDMGNVETMPQRLVAGMDSFLLLTVPFFILTGLLMNQGGITTRIFAFANHLVGHIRGGLGHVNVMASVIFSGSSGSAQADAAGLGLIQIEGMRRRGWAPDLAAAITGASATIGPIIPPSIILVVYGSLASVSVGALLIAGIIPGLIMAGTLMVAVYLLATVKKIPADPRSSLRQIGRSFASTAPALLAPVVLIGGILGGRFTPSEAGAIAVLYTLVVSMFVYRELRLRDLPKIMGQLAVGTSGIMLIIGGASPLGYVITLQQVPQQLMSALPDVADNPVMGLLLINLIVLVAGMFLEGLAVLAIMVPILLPLAVSMGVDPVHFGVIICLNLMIGTITPPVGVVAYIVTQIANVSYGRLLKAIWPFLIALLVALLIVTFNEDLVLWLPRKLL